MKEQRACNPASSIHNNLPIKAVIFDMDGTLIASTETDFSAWKKLFADYGRILTFDQYQPLLGIKGADVIQEQLKLSGDDLQNALSQRLFYIKESVATHGINPIPNADAFLKSLKNYPVKIALATSARRPKMELVMQATGLLKYFEVIITGDEVDNGKPAPDIFLKAAEKLQTPARECLVFEDAKNGVQAAKSAGMKCVALTTTLPKDELQQADLIIDSFKEISFLALCKKFAVEGN